MLENCNPLRVTALLVVLCIVSLTLALATIIVFASLRRREAEEFLDDVAATARAARARRPPPPLLEGVLVEQPRGRLVAGMPCEAV